MFLLWLPYGVINYRPNNRLAAAVMIGCRYMVKTEDEIMRLMSAPLSTVYTLRSADHDVIVVKPYRPHPRSALLRVARVANRRWLGWG